MDGLDEVERWSLERSIAQIETVIAHGTASYGSSMTSMLVRFVENAKQRLGHLDQQDQFVAEEKRKQGAQELAIAHLVGQETALNHAEREQYGAFLAKEFFTKSDFGELAGFYTNTWDRLTEGGKAQMSHRVWEGVRRDEYRFSELPDPVKEKEAQSLREMFSMSKRSLSELDNIPERDRDDFINAWDSGEKRGAYEVLDRPVFAQNVAKTSERVQSEKAVGNDLRKAADITKLESGRADSPVKGAAELMGSLDFSADDLPEVAMRSVKAPAAVVAKVETGTKDR